MGTREPSVSTIPILSRAGWKWQVTRARDDGGVRGAARVILVVRQSIMKSITLLITLVCASTSFAEPPSDRMILDILEDQNRMHSQEPAASALPLTCVALCVSCW